MSEIAWQLRRLAAMGPAEVAHRTRVVVRNRLAPPAYARWTPEQAFERFFPEGLEAALRSRRLDRIALLPADAAGLEPFLDAARELTGGRWRLFGRPVHLDDPPRWRRNYALRSEWPDLPSAALDPRRIDLAGGVKSAWELGRLTFLPTLALAWRVRGDREAAERAARWLEDFTRANPLGRGIHHTSGIEMAVRVIAVTWTLALLKGSGAERRLGPSLGLLVQQALHCRDHLSLGSSANNHLISEYAAMTVAGAVFPSLRDADRLLERGLAGLERETLRQIHPDGVPAEQAFGYLPFVWELLLAGFVAASAAGRTVGRETRDRLAASLEFARTIRLPDGRCPQVGDEDDGRILLAAEGPGRLDLVGNALAAWLGREGLGAEQALAMLLTGHAAEPARGPAEGAREFHDGGYTVWRSGGLLVTFDHGPLGLGSLAAHGHADALSVTIFDGATPIVLDPGTFAYQEDSGARDECRGTPAHATVQFRGGSQSRMRGPFLWGERARIRRRLGGWECRWAGGEWHARGVQVEGREIRIVDRVANPDAVVTFPLAPGAALSIEGRRATVRIGGTSATFEGEGIAEWRQLPGAHAPRYGTVISAPKLVAAIQRETCRTVIRVER